MSHNESMLTKIQTAINMTVLLAGVVVFFIGIRVGNEPIAGMTKEQIAEMMNEQGNPAGPMAISLMAGGLGLIICGVSGIAIRHLIKKKAESRGSRDTENNK